MNVTHAVGAALLVGSLCIYFSPRIEEPWRGQPLAGIIAAVGAALMML